MNSNITWDELKQDLLAEFSAEPENRFVEAMFVVAECELEENKQLRDIEGVNRAIAQIACYVKENKSANDAVNNMFGFAEKKVAVAENTATVEAWSRVFEKMSSSSLKEYLYFVADMKIKSTVYLLRIHNFLKNGGLKNVYETKESLEEQRKEITIHDVEGFFDKQLLIAGEQEPKKIKVIEGLQFERDKIGSEENKKAWKYIDLCNEYERAKDEAKKRQYLAELVKLEQDRVGEYEEKEKLIDGELPFFSRYQEIIEKQREYRLSDVKYYLFDNSMKEVCFVGVGWNWLWKYELGEVDLFRCSDGKDHYTYKGGLEEEGRIYYQQMIKNIVEHMNKGKDKCKLASYSKDPFLDIYKYMSLHNKGGEYYFKVSKDENGELQVELKYREQGMVKDEPYKVGEVTFAMVKKAKTNIIKPLRHATAEKDYTVRLLDGKEVSGQVSDEPWCSFSEFVTKSSGMGEHIFCVDILNNTVRYRGDVRNILGNYVEQFPEIKDIGGLQRALVASKDKEVVMLGNTCEKIVRVDKAWDKSYGGLDNNTEYRVNLSGKEIIGLFKRVGGGKVPVFNIAESRVRKNDCDIKIEGMEELLETQNVLMEDMDERSRIENRRKAKQRLEKSIREAIQEYLEKLCDESRNNWKLQFIEQFTQKYDDRHNYLGATVYEKQSGDPFVNFCREVYMK